MNFSRDSTSWSPLEDGKLMTQATGQGKVQVFPETETKFFLKVTDAQIEFFKDDKGAVTHLVLHQGPAEDQSREEVMFAARHSTYLNGEKRESICCVFSGV